MQPTRHTHLHRGSPPWWSADSTLMRGMLLGNGFQLRPTVRPSLVMEAGDGPARYAARLRPPARCPWRYLRARAMTKKVYPNLKRALNEFGIPQENHNLIERIAQAIPIERYEERSGHIHAVRSDQSRPDLHIHSGWTDGFVSEAEALDATGRPGVPGECRGHGFFSVVHPLVGFRNSEGSPRRPTRTYGYCDTCRYELLPTGICSDCD